MKLSEIIQEVEEWFSSEYGFNITKIEETTEKYGENNYCCHTLKYKVYYVTWGPGDRRISEDEKVIIAYPNGRLEWENGTDVIEEFKYIYNYDTELIHWLWDFENKWRI